MDDPTIENVNKEVVPNPLHGLALSKVLDLSGTSDRRSIRPQRTSVRSSGDNSFSRDSVIREDPRINYKKATEVGRSLPEFNGKNISVNRFIRECKEAEVFINPGDKDFFLKLVQSRVTGEATGYLQFKTFDDLNQLLTELKEVFAPSQNLPQVQMDLARVKQNKQEKVSEYGLRVKRILPKAQELIYENFSLAIARGMMDGTVTTAVECFILGLDSEVAAQMIGKTFAHPWSGY